MSRAPARFREADVKRAVRAAQSAGLGIARIEIDSDGKIVIVPGEPEPAKPADKVEAWFARRNNARAS